MGVPARVSRRRPSLAVRGRAHDGRRHGTGSAAHAAASACSRRRRAGSRAAAGHPRADPGRGGAAVQRARLCQHHAAADRPAVRHPGRQHLLPLRRQGHDRRLRARRRHRRGHRCGAPSAGRIAGRCRHAHAARRRRRRAPVGHAASRRVHRGAHPHLPLCVGRGARPAPLDTQCLHPAVGRTAAAGGRCRPAAQRHPGADGAAVPGGCAQLAGRLVRPAAWRLRAAGRADHRAGARWPDDAASVAGGWCHERCGGAAGRSDRTPLRRPGGADRRGPEDPAGRDLRPGRPQRQRQDHAHQRHHRLLPAAEGPHHARRPRHHRHGAACGGAARRGAHLPEPGAVQRHDGARQHPARPPRAHAAERRCARRCTRGWRGRRRSRTAAWSRRPSTSCSCRACATTWSTPSPSA